MFWIVYILIEVFLILIPRVYSIRYIRPNYPNLPVLPNQYIGKTINNTTEKLKKNRFYKLLFVPFIEAFTINGLFYPMQFFLLYIIVFPSMIGVLTRSYEGISKIGGEFLYGMYVSGNWMPIYDQYGIILFLIIGIYFYDLMVIVYTNHREKRPNIIVLIILVLSFIAQMILACVYTIVSAGIVSVFISPFPVWFCIYSWSMIIIIIVRSFRNKNQQNTINTELTV